MENLGIGIHPPYQAFYHHSMAFITASAAQSAEDLNKALKNWPSCLDDAVLNPVQNIVLQAAALSRYFWPAHKKDIHSDRADFLRRKFKIEDNSPLKSRDLRNALEHFDERLDKYLEQGIVGHIKDALNAKPQVKAYKLYDRDGLCLLIRETGTKVWQYHYKYGSQRKTLTIGQYINKGIPGHIGLKEARIARYGAKDLLNQGIDPNTQKQAQISQLGGGDTTFEAVGREWHSKGTWVFIHDDLIRQ